MKLKHGLVRIELLVLIATLGIGMLSNPAVAQAPRVAVDSGELEGLWITAPDKSDVAAFRGIPYAKPPVGELRWRAPEPPDSWSGVRQATSFGATCYQAAPTDFSAAYSKLTGIDFPSRRRAQPNQFVGGDSEDCLYLNVYSESLDPDARRPVMVWIHGGGFNFGSGNGPNPQHLVRKGVVVVTINYRLNVLGFLAHPELSEESSTGTSGNYGLMDQIESLKWVKRNIEAFGGDPDNVTIFGMSAGGMAVSMLMASPPAKGLFHRGIAQSGTGLQYHRHQRKDAFPHASAESWGQEFAQSIGKPTLAALREMDADKLVRAGVDFHHEWTRPHIDGHVIVEHPAQSFREGRVHPVPFMTGSKADEAWRNYPYLRSPIYEIPGPIDTVEQYREAIQRIFETDAARALELYPASNDEEMIHSSLDLLGDSLFGAQAHYVAARLARVGKAPYLFFFTRTGPGERGKKMGAHHGIDIGYVFGYAGTEPESEAEIARSEADVAMSELIMNYWVQFARTGDPNSANSPRWAPFDAEQNQYMEFGDEAGMADVSRTEKYTLIGAFYDRVISRQ